jgi:hypothetical protein
VDNAEAILEHFGIKGMKWGVRRDKPSVKVTATTRPGRRVKTSGGTGQKSTRDAVTAAKARQKAKKSTVDSLTNKELEGLIKRMKLEQQYEQMKNQHKPAAVKFVLDLLKNQGSQQAKGLASEAGGLIAKTLKEAGK